MSLPASVEAVKNERTEKLFIVLDWDAGDNKLKVINPTGDVLDVVRLIFKMDERITVPASQYATSFSETQLTRLESWGKEKFSYDEKKRLERAARASQTTSKRTTSTTAAPRSKSAVARKEGIVDRKASTSGKRPSAQWNSTELTFYRHRIESLKPSEIFSIAIDGVGTFQITKAEFQRVFNNVVMNADYRSQGVFRYLDIPEEAKAFIK
jgi:hypothetical protein